MKQEDQLSVIRRIASVVGHELRNPLAVINNSAYFLKTKLGADGRLDPKVEKHLGIVASEIARANQMVEDILVYSRPMEAEKKPVALGAVVKATAAAVAAPDKVKLEVKVKDVEVQGDEKLIASAVRRLLDNAVEALAEGGKVTIAVSGKIVEVKDDGKGFPVEALERFGEAFNTTKPRGLGLGLAMAKKIMDAHGGKLEGGNAKGGGASVRLVFPGA